MGNLCAPTSRRDSERNTDWLRGDIDDDEGTHAKEVEHDNVDETKTKNPVPGVGKEESEEKRRAASQT